MLITNKMEHIDAQWNQQKSACMKYKSVCLFSVKSYGSRSFRRIIYTFKVSFPFQTWLYFSNHFIVLYFSLEIN